MTSERLADGTVDIRSGATGVGRARDADQREGGIADGLDGAITTGMYSGRQPP